MMHRLSLSLLALGLAALAFRAGRGWADEHTRYMIMVTGGELLSGALPDGHTPFLTRTLRPLGLRCVGSMIVDDNLEDIRSALGYATQHAELVIVTGGLGPTDNDVTCEAIAGFTGIAVEENPEVLEAIARRFRTTVEGLRGNLRRQTRVPVGGTYLKNSSGTAVGLVFDCAKRVVVALPGPPRELQPMVLNQLMPYLSRRFGTHLPGCSLTVRFIGLGQSAIDQAMKDHLPLSDEIALSSQFDASRVDFTFTLPDDNRENRAKLEDLKMRLLERLGDNIYATDDRTSLEDSAVAALAARGATLSLAEVASGGAVTAALCRAEGADSVLAGAYVAANAETMRRLLGVSEDRWPEPSESAKRLELLAEACARATGSQWAAVVGPVRNGAGGRRDADVLLRGPDGRVAAAELAVSGSAAASHQRLTTQIVDLFRRQFQLK